MMIVSVKVLGSFHSAELFLSVLNIVPILALVIMTPFLVLSSLSGIGQCIKDTADNFLFWVNNTDLSNSPSEVSHNYDLLFLF